MEIEVRKRRWSYVMESSVQPLDPSRVSVLLAELCGGNQTAADELFPVIYDELRARARRFLRIGGSGARLRATEVVHEAYLRLVDQATVDWRGRTHFFAVAAKMMPSPEARSLEV